LKRQVIQLENNKVELEKDKKTWSGWSCELELELEKIGYELHSPKTGVSSKKL
jgi:hypothetical protein